MHHFLACTLDAGFVDVPEFSGSVVLSGSTNGHIARQTCMALCGSDLLVPNVTASQLHTIVNGALSAGKSISSL